MKNAWFLCQLKKISYNNSLIFIRRTNDKIDLKCNFSCIVPVLLLYFCCTFLIFFLYYFCIFLVFFLYCSCIVLVLFLHFSCILLVFFLYSSCIFLVLLLYFSCIFLIHVSSLVYRYLSKFEAFKFIPTLEVDKQILDRCPRGRR